VKPMFVVAAAAALLLAGCGSASPGPAPATSPPAPPSAAAKAAAKVAPEPSFADLTQARAKSVVKVFAFDAENQSAVVEPIIFLTGEDYCKAFKVKASDARCDHEWLTEESHTKVTVPVADNPAFFTWEGPDGNVCVETPADGGTCRWSAKSFAKWVADEPGGMAVIATQNGEIVRMAQIYTP
jgi:hypothetical protein